MNDPKILICGVGSIGEQHINNLLNLGYENIILYRTKKTSLRTIKRKFVTFNNLDEALKDNPTVAFICNPTFLHLETAIICAKANCHLFIEKPISSSSDGVLELEKICNDNKLICMVGYMMRYHPQIIKIKEIIKRGDLGKIVFYRSQWGEFLPDWHPWEDYRQSYAANSYMGGGAGLTLSHDIDLCLWICDKKIRKIVRLDNRGSDLQIKSEHGVDILISFFDKTSANLHLDYFQLPPKREIEIIGTKGKIIFDYYSQKLMVSYNSNKNKVFSMKKFNRNQLLIDELLALFVAIKTNSQSPISISEGLQSLKVLECEKI